MSKMSEIYRFNTSSSFQVYSATHEVSEELWHRRLGHLNRQCMCLLKEGMVSGFKFREKIDPSPCVPCIKEKMQRLPFKYRGKRASDLLKLKHSDLCGPMENTSEDSSIS